MAAGSATPHVQPDYTADVPLRASLATAALCLLTVAGGTQAPDVPGATGRHGGFGLPDPRGARLLVIPNLSRPELLKVALCSRGRRLSIEFDRRQAARGNGDGRQTPSRFDELSGNVFTVLMGRIEADATCFLASETLLAGSTLLSFAAPAGSGACAQPGRFAALRGRPVIRCWPVARLSADGQIVLLEFERRGRDALASLVLVDGTRTIFADYPAEFRGTGQDLWRVDDAGVLFPEAIDIVCALQGRESYVLGVAWNGAEGKLLQLWTADGTDQFTKVINDYWYQAPR